MSGGEADLSLAVDVAAVSAGVRSFVASRDGVSAYVAAMAAVPLGERPIVVDGAERGRYDPLGQHPELARPLHGAQYAAEAMRQILESLRCWGSGGMGTYLRPIVDQLERVRVLMAAVPAGADLSDEAAGEVARSLSTAGVYVQVVAMTTGQIRAGVLGFLGRVGADHEALARGATSVAEARRRVVEETTATALRYASNPFTAGLSGIVVQIGGQLAAALENLGGSLDRALEGQEGMRSGVSALATAVEAVRAKSDGAASAFSRAQASARLVVLRKIAVVEALTSWRQLDEFLTHSGL